MYRERAVACRGGGRTGRRPRASKVGGHPKSEITKIAFYQIVKNICFFVT